MNTAYNFALQPDTKSWAQRPIFPFTAICTQNRNISLAIIPEI